MKMETVQQAITGQEVYTDIGAPYAALVDFYAAFNGGDLQAMRENWLQAEQASMSNPLGGVKRGWREIEAVYDKIFNGPADVYVEYYDYSIHVTDKMFCAVGRERGKFILHGQTIELAIRTSRIYTHDGQGWKQIHHHGSIH